MPGQRPLVTLAAVSFLAAVALPATAQLPLAPITASGQAVVPVFEGWYANPDGTYSLSFGYHNRNSEEVLEIPVGSHNRLEPGAADRGQPTRFEPRRHWGVFAVRVPANFGDREIVWTLEVRGETHRVPGSLEAEWEIDALEGEAGAGNTPPRLRFDPGGPEGAGPAGIAAGPIRARAGEPVTLTVWASDDGRPDTSIVSGGREGVPVTLTWMKHRGPGEVTFDEPEARVPVGGGEATATAVFGAPGEYVVRVRANDASGVSGAGHAQCCWSNGFLRVAVEPGPAAGAVAPETVTYAADVAPILRDKCQICHQPDSVAPMSLLTYRDARRWAGTIKEKVAARVMPPWHINRTVGIRRFQNDRGLTDEQIETIVRWVDAGAPLGDEADLPPPAEFSDPNRWQLSDRFGEPDLVVKSEPYTLAAETQDKWFRPVVDTGLTEPRWVRAIEIRFF